MHSFLFALALGALAAGSAAAQVAPTAPTRPVAPTPAVAPVPPVAAMPAPRAVIAPEAIVEALSIVDLARLDSEAMLLAAEAPRLAYEAELLAAEAPRLAHEAELLATEAPRLAHEAQALTLEATHLAMAMDVAAMHDAGIALEAAHLAAGAEHLSATAPVAMYALPAQAPRAWAAQDPADSLYRVARETLNRSEYRRAAQLFRQVRERHPRSEYVSEASYWEAFALYRVGTTDDLRTALRVLDQQGTYSRKETQANANALQARVLGALARRGDAGAQVRVAAAARNGTTTCDSEDLMVRVEALNALSQLDQAAAMPLLRRVLARRDECSASLRRSAVSLAARRGGGESLALLTEVAMNDPSSSVRSVAVSNISKLETDEAAAALENMLRSPDDNVRRTAARALARRTDARSRRAVRAYLESPQTSEAQKAEAIHNFNRETATADDVAFLRALFARTDSERVRSAIVSMLPRLAPDEGRAWLAGIARDGNQPTSSRAAAISALSRDNSVPVVDLARMYDAANERRIREHVVMALGRRSEPEATEKLIDIARNGTDPVVRSAAVNQLARKKDPRLATILQELIDR